MRTRKHPWDKCPLGRVGTEPCGSQLKGQGLNISPALHKPPASPSLGTPKRRDFAVELLRGARTHPTAEGCRSCPQWGFVYSSN